MLYFFDDFSIRAMEGLVRVPGPVEKLGTVLRPDRPSDGQRCMSFASSIVGCQEKGWRMYYTVSEMETKMMGIAVAESVDGLKWEKPELGQMQVDGKGSNRLAIQGLPAGVERYGQPQVWQEEEGGWRMYFWVNNRPYLRYVVAQSADGMRWEAADFEEPVIYHPLELGSWIWTPGVAPPEKERGEGHVQGALERFVPGSSEARWGHLLERCTADQLVRLKGLRANDAVYIFRALDTGCYEFYAPWPLCNLEGSPRRFEHDNAPFMLRAIHRRTSVDGMEWSDPELLIVPDERDRLDQQFYYLAVHRQDGWQIGLMGSYLVYDQTMDIELCFSRDGRRWDRPLRMPWVPRESDEEAGMIHAPNRLVDAGSDWLLLYSASCHRHNEVRHGEKGKVGAEVRAARFPKRRFLGLSARGGGAGMLLTRPFILGGAELCVDARIDGWLRAELCDPFGTPLPGLEKGRFKVLSGDSTGHVMRWREATTEHYQHNAVSLRLELERGEIYNIHWR